MNSEQAQKLIDEVFDFCCDTSKLKNSQKIYEENKDLMLEKINNAIQLDPDNVEAYNVKAFLYDCLCDENSAIKWYEKALEIDPDNEEAKEYINLYKESNGVNKSPLSLDFDEELSSETSPIRFTILHILIFKLIVIICIILWFFHTIKVYNVG